MLNPMNAPLSQRPLTGWIEQRTATGIAIVITPRRDAPVLLCTLVAGMNVVVLSLALPADAPLLIRLLILPCLALLYGALVEAIDVTCVVLEPSGLRRMNRPLPVPSDFAWPLEDLECFEWRRTARAVSGGSVAVDYLVEAVSHTGVHRKITTFGDQESAVRAVQTLKDRLGEVRALRGVYRTPPA